jgi:ADP-ribose pyrophosphatase YjhB (NUDIX family)
VRERDDNRWTLPGGWADVCETPSQGIVREVFEESGFVVDNPRLIAIKDRSVHPYKPVYPHHIYKLFFFAHWYQESQRKILKSQRSDSFLLMVFLNYQKLV